MIKLSCAEMDRDFAKSCGGEYACTKQTTTIRGKEYEIFTDDLDELCGDCKVYKLLLQLKELYEALGNEVTLFA